MDAVALLSPITHFFPVRPLICKRVAMFCPFTPTSLSVGGTRSGECSRMHGPLFGHEQGPRGFGRAPRMVEQVRCSLGRMCVLRCAGFASRSTGQQYSFHRTATTHCNTAYNIALQDCATTLRCCTAAALHHLSNMELRYGIQICFVALQYTAGYRTTIPRCKTLC